VGTAVSVIRPMRTEDLPAVLALEQAHQPRPWSEKVFGDEMSAEGRSTSWPKPAEPSSDSRV
jgi:hypothetical protein